MRITLSCDDCGKTIHIPARTMYRLGPLCEIDQMSNPSCPAQLFLSWLLLHDSRVNSHLDGGFDRFVKLLTNVLLEVDKMSERLALNFYSRLTNYKSILRAKLLVAGRMAENETSEDIMLINVVLDRLINRVRMVNFVLHSMDRHMSSDDD